MPLIVLFNTCKLLMVSSLSYLILIICVFFSLSLFLLSLNLSIINILSWIILLWELFYRMFSSIPGLYLLDTSNSELWHSVMPADITKCPWWVKSPLNENHWVGGLSFLLIFAKCQFFTSLIHIIFIFCIST